MLHKKVKFSRRDNSSLAVKELNNINSFFSQKKNKTPTETSTNYRNFNKSPTEISRKFFSRIKSSFLHPQSHFIIDSLILHKKVIKIFHFPLVSRQGIFQPEKNLWTSVNIILPFWFPYENCKKSKRIFISNFFRNSWIQ